MAFELEVVLFTWKKIFTIKIGIKKLFDHGIASKMPLLTDEI
jgi:hypothetical protein